MYTYYIDEDDCIVILSDNSEDVTGFAFYSGRGYAERIPNTPENRKIAEDYCARFSE